MSYLATKRHLPWMEFLHMALMALHNNLLSTLRGSLLSTNRLSVHPCCNGPRRRGLVQGDACRALGLTEMLQ